ncbi:hypothetical protein LIA77_11326 [Sarocladium implicatum]|nr:hypothetical protein LIA77_11326 [Sarocladium implicatum]
MKFTVAAVLAAAATGAHAYGKNVTYVTETVDSYVTYCPLPTEIVHGDKTITVTEPGTITITDCPCTVTKPVVEETHSVCYDCPEKPEAPPAPPAETPVVPPPAGTGGVTPTGEAPPSVPTAGAGKAAALSGAGLAGVVGLAAFIL